MADNELVVIVLLPGMDGTGRLFRPFTRFINDHGASDIEVQVVTYPEDKYLTYEQLADQVQGVLPESAPYVVIAESYSGPVAALLAANAVGNLQAVVFVSSFIARPCGRIGTLAAKLVPTVLFRCQPPAWVIRHFLAGSDAGPEMIAALQAAITLVSPEVLVRRLQDALRADFVQTLRGTTVRIVCLLPESDRLLGFRGLRGFLAVRPDLETVRIPGPHLLLQCAPEVSFTALRSIGLFGDHW